MMKSKKPFQLPNRQHNLFQGLVDLLMAESSVALCLECCDFGRALVSFALCMTRHTGQLRMCNVIGLSGFLMQSFVQHATMVKF